MKQRALNRRKQSRPEVVEAFKGKKCVGDYCLEGCGGGGGGGEGGGKYFPCSRFQAFQAGISNRCCSCEFLSIRDDKRAELFVPCGCITGRMPTPTILISLATWLGIYATHQIPDSMCAEALASPNASQQCLTLPVSLLCPEVPRHERLRLLRRAVGLMKKLEMNQLNYRLSHPAAALQTNLAKDMDKYSRIRFDYASFDAQVFGKQPLMAANPEQEMSPFSDCELFRILFSAHRADV